jgi:hypothetical protein
MAYSLGNACTHPVDGSVGSAEGLCQPAQALPQGFESYRCVALFRTLARRKDSNQDSQANTYIE